MTGEGGNRACSVLRGLGPSQGSRAFTHPGRELGSAPGAPAPSTALLPSLQHLHVMKNPKMTPRLEAKLWQLPAQTEKPPALGWWHCSR